MAAAGIVLQTPVEPAVAALVVIRDATDPGAWQDDRRERLQERLAAVHELAVRALDDAREAEHG